MKIKVYNLYKQFGRGRGDVYDWTNRQVIVREDNRLESNNDLSSPIEGSKVIQNKDVTIFVTNSGSVYVSSTSQLVQAAQIQPVQQQPPPAPTSRRPATITRSRVPSGTRARNRLNRTTGRQGADLIQALENDTEYRNYFYGDQAIQGVQPNQRRIAESTNKKQGLKALIEEKNLNEDTVNRMMGMARSWATRSSMDANAYKEWWRRIHNSL